MQIDSWIFRSFPAFRSYFPFEYFNSYAHERSIISDSRVRRVVLSPAVSWLLERPRKHTDATLTSPYLIMFFSVCTSPERHGLSNYAEWFGLFFLSVLCFCKNERYQISVPICHRLFIWRFLTTRKWYFRFTSIRSLLYLTKLKQLKKRLRNWAVHFKITPPNAKKILFQDENVLRVFYSRGCCNS